MPGGTARGEWNAPDGTQRISFRPDGRLEAMEHQNPEGSMARTAYVYDEAGRLTEAQWRTDDGPASRELHMYDDARRLIREVHAEDGQPMREVMTCSYDDTGLMTAVRIFDPVRQHASYAIKGGEMSYTVPGVASMWTEYDRRDLLAAVRFLDVAGELLARVVVTRGT
jgi:hypothetical protein